MAHDGGHSGTESEGPGPRLLLVLCDAPLRGGLLDELRRRATGEAARIQVVAPAVSSSPVDEGAGDLEEARAAAAGRLRESLEVLDRAGIEADGEVGDSELAVAVADAVAFFDPQEVILATRPAEASPFVSAQDIERVRTENRVPVAHVMVDPELGAEVVAVDRDAGGGPGPQESAAAEASLVADEQPVEMSEAITHMSPRAWLALGMGVVATAALIALGIDCAVAERTIAGACGIRMLLALAASIVLFWHIVALVLMRTVHYQGLWHDLAADVLLFGTPPAVLVSFLLG